MSDDLTIEQSQFLSTAGLIYRTLMADTTATAMELKQGLDYISTIFRQAVLAGVDVDTLADVTGVDLLTVHYAVNR